MMKSLIPLLMLCFLVSCSDSQKTKMKQDIIQQANAQGKAFINKDYNTLVDNIHPRWAQGKGRDELFQNIKASVDGFILTGISIDSIVSSSPDEIIKHGNSLQTTLKLAMHGKMFGIPMVKITPAIAISEDRGKMWHIISPNSHDDLKNMQKHFDFISPQLTIPKDKLIIENTPVNNFLIFWNDFKLNYPAFQLNHINWDSLYAVNYAKIIVQPTDSTLFSIFNVLIYNLKDVHSGVSAKQFGNCKYVNKRIAEKQANFLGKEVVYKYMNSHKTISDNLFYGFIDNVGNRKEKIMRQEVGYIYIGSFSGKESEYQSIDQCLEFFKDTKGLIIDVRGNGGGNEMYARIIASRFTPQKLTYRYSQTRNGQKYDEITDFSPLQLEPKGNNPYTRPVILLTDKKTFSAAEDFTLMLKSLPQVIHLGDTTLGGVATRPINKTLPNGWKYRMSRNINSDLNKRPILNGIAPDVPIQISKEDAAKAKDRILEEAIKQIKEKQVIKI